jgi:hypothetical protein
MQHFCNVTRVRGVVQRRPSAVLIVIGKFKRQVAETFYSNGRAIASAASDARVGLEKKCQNIFFGGKTAHLSIE